MTGKRTIIIAVIAGVLASIAIFGAGLVMAADNGPRRGARHEMRHEGMQGRHGAMQGRHEARLDRAVKDGDITEAQKKAIVKKMDAIHETMKKQHDDLEKWLKDNDIDPGLVGPAAGGCGMMGEGETMRGMMRGH